MKVLYTFSGMPHYLNAMLNKLHNKGVEITVITPQKGNATIGKGVKMVREEHTGTSPPLRRKHSTEKAPIPPYRK